MTLIKHLSAFVKDDMSLSRQVCTAALNKMCDTAEDVVLLTNIRPF